MNMNEFVAPAQEQNTQHHHHHQQPNQQHHQHQHQQQHPAAMIDTGKVSEIPNQPDIKQVHSIIAIQHRLDLSQKFPTTKVPSDHTVYVRENLKRSSIPWAHRFEF